jgi:hypothetical protein
MAYGLKLNETRHWKTDYRGPLVIHAAKKPLTQVGLEGGWLEEFTELIEEKAGPDFKFPLGALVCVVNLFDCDRTEHVRERILEIEENFGNYEEGRFAWQTDKCRRFAEPIPWKGAQGFFDVPDEIVKQALARAVGGEK